MSNALNENAVTLLGSAVIGMQTADGKQDVYTIPTGKQGHTFFYVIHSPTGSLAGGTDFDLGSGAAADTWRQTVNLSSMTATTDYMVIPPIAATPVKYTREAAGAVLGIKPITGSTGDFNATVEVWGRLLDA